MASATGPTSSSRAPNGCRALTLALGIALVSCKRTPATSEVTPVSSAAPKVVVTTTSTDAAPPEAASANAPSSNDRIHEVVRRWNAAHAKRDAQALEDVYAESVSHYGTKMARAAVVKAKAAAFGAASDFTQSIGKVDIEPALNPGTFAARFAKTVTKGGKTKDYPAILVVRDERVVEENDDVDWCLAADGSGTNDRLVMPFTMSGADAVAAARRTQHFKASAAKHPALIIDIKGFSCAKVCAQPSLECGFHMRTSDLDAKNESNLVEWLYVDPVTKKLWFYDLPAMEKSPDRGEIWRSEPLSAN